MIRIYSLRPMKNGQLTHKRFNVTRATIKELFADYKGVLEEIRTKHSKELLFNIFYTAGNCTEDRKVSTQSIIPIDVDDIANADDPVFLQPYINIIAKVTGTNPKQCGIIATGNGLHYLIPVKPFPASEFPNKRKQYRALCNYLNSAFEAEILTGRADPAIWSDARLLRLPDTENRKPMQEPHSEKAIVKKCLCINGNLEIQDFSLDEKWIVKKVDKEKVCKIDAPKVVASCNFLKNQWNLRGEGSSEPEWYAMLGLAAWFDDSDELAHVMSKGHSSYDRDETAAKCDHAREADGPRSCESIQLISKHCEDCKYLGKIKNPLQLGFIKTINAEEFSSATPKIGHTNEQGRTENTLPELEDDTSDVSNSKDPSSKDKEDTQYSEEDWQKFIKAGFTDVTKDEHGRIKKINRAHNLLRKYFDHLHHYVRLGDIKRVMVYKDGYFKRISPDSIKQFANDYYRPIITKNNDREEFLHNICTHNVTTAEWLNSSPEGLINCKNGVVRVATGELLPHDPKYRFLYCLPYNYEPEATCSTWNMLLKNVTLDRQPLFDTLNEFLGYCLAGCDYKHQKVLILKGNGENGKSTVLKAFEMILGSENVSSIPVSSLTRQFMAGGLEGKLANYSEDEGPSCFKDTGILKKITGNTPIWVEHKYESGYSMLNKAKLIMTYNTMPFLDDTSEGMRRRLLILPFDLNLQDTPEKCIPNIFDKLRSELPGILNCGIAGWQRLEKRGKFLHIVESDEEINDMMYNSSSVFEWCSSFLEFTHDCEDYVSNKEAYTSFQMEYGMNSCQNTWFGRELQKWLRVKKWDTRQSTKEINGIRHKIYRKIKLIKKKD